MEKYLLLIIYVAFLALLSIFTFFLYGIDKSKAKNGSNRIKEKTLLFFVALGGAIGGFIGRIIFHHKTDKSYFSIIIYSSLLFEAGVVALICYFTFGGRIWAH